LSSFADYLERARHEIDLELDRRLPGADLPPARLHAAMRYSVFAGGKRLRPALVRLAGETFGAPAGALSVAGAAVEMIHTYSLIHDDLPALDDDDLRRGRPTLHRAFDEATAILAGDALLTLGLTLLAGEPAGVPGERRALATARLGAAIGTGGMIGGQVEDLEAERDWPADPAVALDRIHRRKTGALLVESLRLGGLHASVSEAQDLILKELGERIGLMFQIRDDILDIEGSVGALGKTPGKDAEARKLTYPGLFGLERSRARIVELAEEASRGIESLPSRREIWRSLVDFLARRGH
jgi:geranylgeranyl pyrophosphate synthase